MQELDLIESVGPLAQRYSDTILDTDGRTQRFSYTTNFRDRAQSGRAIAYIQSRAQPGIEAPESLHSLIRNAVFSCWETGKHLTEVRVGQAG